MINEYFFEKTGNSKLVSYGLVSRRGVEICWKNKSDPSYSRIPRENSTEISLHEPFIAAGKNYKDYKDFMTAVKKNIEAENTFPVFAFFAERFPCFDSYDYATEDRYHQFTFIMEDGSISRVYHSTDSPTVTLTRDVQFVDYAFLNVLEAQGLFINK